MNSELRIWITKYHNECSVNNKEHVMTPQDYYVTFEKSLLLRLEPCKLLGWEIFLSNRSTKLEKWKEGPQMLLFRHIRILLPSDAKAVKLLMFFPHKSEKNEQKKAKCYSQKEKKSISTLLPNVVNVYDKFMGGEDRIDQKISCCKVHLRSKKWWWPLFRFYIDVAVNNAFQLYRLRKLDAENHAWMLSNLDEQL